MVDFLSLFCLELQILINQINDLTRKGSQFILEEEQQNASDEIKRRLQKPQKVTIQHLPDNKGKFHL